MGELNLLLSNYSISDVVIIVAAVLLIVIAILRGWDYLWGKIRTKFGMENEHDQWKKDVSDNLGKIDGIQTSLVEIQNAAEKRSERLSRVEEYVKNDYEREKRIEDSLNEITDWMQDDTRWDFRDAYNYYCVKLKQIDPNALEALEHKYEHYKNSNGNSFVDTVMAQLRLLPIVPYEGVDIDD